MRRVAEVEEPRPSGDQAGRTNTMGAVITVPSSLPAHSAKQNRTPPRTARFPIGAIVAVAPAGGNGAGMWSG